MEKHLCDIKNELSYFKTVVKNMDLDDIKREKKHTDNNIHYEEFLDETSSTIFQIVTESKYKGILHWIDLIQNEKLHKAIECLSDEEKYLISFVFYEDRTQEEIANIFNVNQSSVFYKINRIIYKIKNIYSKNRI